MHAPEVLDQWTNDLGARLEYRKADVTKPEQVQAALAALKEAAVLYLALPPKVLLPAVRSIVAGRVLEGSRIVVEKPFGTDLHSTRAVNEMLDQGFPEKAVFRMDHFLDYGTDPK
jgi:glucose-6-phosphate 1-dehydrogenase